jgi:alkylhydroperoxidase family enzyme
MRCGPNETGEAIGLISKSQDDAGARFDGYTAAAETEKKILRDVFESGDAWFRTGDLMRRDDSGFYYFADRIGDTFRWKGENIATSEVAAAITSFPGILDANVYGVSIPGTDGRAGMAEIVCVGALDVAALREHLLGRLPHYAVPVLLRVRSEIDLTPTFKQRKNAPEQGGYDPAACPDALYVHDPARRAFMALDQALYQRIQAGQFRLWRDLAGPHNRMCRVRRRWRKVAHPIAVPPSYGPTTMQTRFAPLSEQDMTPEQKRVAHAVASGPRGGLRGPFHALLRSPELADRVRHLGDFVRFESTFPAPLRELAILLVARFWSAHYEWNAHRKHAVAAGLDPAIPAAIETGRRPAALSPDEAIVYDLISELLADKDISDATYEAAKRRFGERAIVELICTAGYYGFVSLVLNAARTPVPEGGTGLPPLPPR